MDKKAKGACPREWKHHHPEESTSQGIKSCPKTLSVGELLLRDSEVTSHLICDVLNDFKLRPKRNSFHVTSNPCGDDINNSIYSIQNVELANIN